MKRVRAKKGRLPFNIYHKGTKDAPLSVFGVLVVLPMVKEVARKGGKSLVLILSLCLCAFVVN
jgi:hypothetical protein